MTVELACPGPTPDSAGRFEEVATQVWDQLVPSATRAIGVLCDYLQSILRCRDDLAASSLAPEALVELQQAYDFLAHVSIPGALPPAWWPMPARWARLLSERVARGDPNGAVLARSISQWQDRAGLAEARLSHPSVMQYRLLLESRRAQLHGGDSGGVRVDDALLAQQWALVEATA